MKEFVGNFIQMKIENSGVLNQEQCDDINKCHKDLGLTFTIQPEKTVKNDGLRQVSKICLNSLWGKFGQSTQLDSYEFMKSYNSLVTKMQDPKVKIKNFNIVHENLVEMKFQEDNDMSIDMEYKVRLQQSLQPVMPE